MTHDNNDKSYIVFSDIITFRITLRSTVSVAYLLKKFREKEGAGKLNQPSSI